MNNCYAHKTVFSLLTSPGPGFLLKLLCSTMAHF